MKGFPFLSVIIFYLVFYSAALIYDNYKHSPTFVSHKKSDGFSCENGYYKYCRDMSSCREAKYYFNQCGISRLDGDNDGVPCERICGHR